MKTIIYDVLGVMSGTSLDGIDLACVHFEWSQNRWEFAIGAAETVPYPPHWKSRLAKGLQLSDTELANLDREYTRYLAEVIQDFKARNPQEKIDWICSHGHTIQHRPAEGYTLQIGNLPQLAEWIGTSVVCDFRVQDVKLGGQGAPLVPIGDRLLFAQYTHCLNLGGFSNISFECNKQRVAYDLTPVNVVLNPLAEQLGADYDDRGNWAREGELIPALLGQLNALDFYAQKGPKSLGMEFVNTIVEPLLRGYQNQPKNILHTWVEHIAWQMAQTFANAAAKVLVTGGGAYNEYLLERLRYYSPTTEFIVPDNKLIEFKEALIFAFLGVLRLEGRVNTLASVTGSVRDHSSGNVFPYLGYK